MKKYLITVLYLLWQVICYGQLQHQWTKSIGSIGSNSIRSMTSDNNSIFILSDACIACDLDPNAGTALINNPYNQPKFIAKYDEAGNYLWHRTLGEIWYIDTDTAGNVYGVGHLQGTSFFDNGMGGYDSITSSGGGLNFNHIIFKYSPNGTLLYLKQTSGYGTYYPYSLHVDKAGNLYFTGTLDGSEDFDPGPGTYQVTCVDGVFFAKYDANGGLQFVNEYAPSGVLSGNAITGITTDETENILITGYCDVNISFGGGTLASGQFIAKYDSNGNYIYSKNISSDGGFAEAIQTDNNNNIYIYGTLSQTTDIAPGPVVSLLNSGGFFAKYDSTAVLVFGRNIGNVCSGIAIDSLQNLYITGAFFYGFSIAYPEFGIPSLIGTNSNLFFSKFDINGYHIYSKKLVATQGEYFWRSHLDYRGSDYIYFGAGFSGTADLDFTTGISSFNSVNWEDLFFSKYELKDDHHLISGHIFNDINHDGNYTPGEPPLNNVIVEVSPGGYFASTNANGDYYCYAPFGNYSITIPTLPTHFSICTPALHTANFPQTSLNQIDTANNFVLMPEVNAQDLRITSTNITPLRPGFGASYYLTSTNVGSMALPATITFEFDTLLSYIASTPLADSVGQNFLSWNIDTLNPTQISNITFDLLVSASANIGDTVHSLANILPFAGDLFTADNKDRLEVIVQGSFDPNDKQVFPSGFLTPQQADTTFLIYTIRFQNTGTDTAFNVNIVDTLSGNLDVSTFEVLSSSHTTNYTISEHGIIECWFKNIMLPDSNIDELKSHGFIKYRIKPKQGLTSGESIENTAYINFDFNSPVTTNTTYSLVSLTSIQEIDHSKTLFIYPNPTHDLLTIDSKKNQFIRIVNSFGETVIETQIKTGKSSIDVSSLSKGVYFIDCNALHEKFIKM